MKNTSKAGIEITVYTNRPKQFWADMGPFFARREVRREMPYLVDDDGFVWFVARDGGKVVGFVSYELTKGGVANVHGLYVVPSERNNGVAEQLLRELMDAAAKAGGKTARATASAKSVALFENKGFAVVTNKGQYAVVEAAL